LHLAGYADKVTILVRSESLADSMSEYLIDEIGASRNVSVRYRAGVAGATGKGRLEQLRVEDLRSGEVDAVRAAALFVLIGAEPRTAWLPPAIARDDWGYVLTGPAASPAAAQRAPLLLETSLPGVFAVGDVRAGSVKRVASAVGEGSICLRLVHEYLEEIGARPNRHGRAPSPPSASS
jgi:thioredoxin reductase (NADPH)